MQNSNGITFIEDWKKKNYFKNKENKFTQLNLKKKKVLKVTTMQKIWIKLNLFKPKLSCNQCFIIKYNP